MPEQNKTFPDGEAWRKERVNIIKLCYDHYWRFHIGKEVEWAKLDCPICVNLVRENELS